METPEKSEALNCEPEQICLWVLAGASVWDGRKEIKKEKGGHRESERDRSKSKGEDKKKEGEIIRWSERGKNWLLKTEI